MQSRAKSKQIDILCLLLTDKRFFMFFTSSRTRFKFDFDMRLIICAMFAELVGQST